jgi:hypothetical protein
MKNRIKWNDDNNKKMLLLLFNYIVKCQFPIWSHANEFTCSYLLVIDH